MGRRDFGRAFLGPLVSILLVLGAGAAAAAPARLRVTVTRDGVAETRIVERTVSRGREAGASAGEKVSLSGTGWRLQGVVAGSGGIDDSSGLAPRGVTVSFFAKLGLAFGFINDFATPVDVEAELCLDPLFLGLPAVYGGSIAGSVLDGEGDGTGSVTTNSVNDPSTSYGSTRHSATPSPRARSRARTPSTTLHRRSPFPVSTRVSPSASSSSATPFRVKPGPRARPRSRWCSVSA